MGLNWVLLAVAYLGLLFWLANWGEGQTRLAKRFSGHPLTYALALGIYCTAWTFYGAVGEATRSNWGYLPILLGPILVYVFGYRLLHKLVQVSKRQHITTIADFIASRYGKRQSVALLVTLIALLATVPYIALQLKAVAAAFVSFSGSGNSQFVVAATAVLMGAIAIIFGTRHMDITQYRRGLMLAIAFESAIKLLALVLVAALAWWWLRDTDTPVKLDFNLQTASIQGSSWLFWAQTLMAAAAVICLPRQFHVAFIDNQDTRHVKSARWLFPLYLFSIALVTPIIATGGVNLLSDSGVQPDSYVLGIANLSDLFLLKVIVFFGGLSAATAMVIVGTLTLSTMLTNDVILPRLLSQSQHQDHSMVKHILTIRRGVIAGLLVLSYGYYQLMVGSNSLSSIGLLAFSLVVQLLPAIIGGLYWKKGHAQGVFAGITMGLTIWLLWLLQPFYAGGAEVQEHSELITQAAMLGLAVNIVGYWLFSIMAHERLIDRMQAEAFVTPTDVFKAPQENLTQTSKGEDLLTLLTTFLGASRARQLLDDYQLKLGYQVDLSAPLQQEFLSFCERALGGVLGASSAKALIDSALKGKKLAFEQVATMFDDTTQAIQFNMNALSVSLESIEQGISVVDKSLNLVAWNKRYIELFDYPDEMIAVGTPIETLVRYNVQRGECGVGETNVLVNKRINHMRAGSPHRYIRQRSDGRVIEMVGNPLPEGGYVTSFTDITALMESQQALEEANVDLENRIQKRSAEVQAINAELRAEISRREAVEQALIEAKKVAEQANASKSRFLALASHDVLQPLNASKLYLSALKECSAPDEWRDLLVKLESSVLASEDLIATLLEIARLDQQAQGFQIKAINLQQLLDPVIQEYRMLAKQKGLIIKSRIANVWVLADRTYLLRIVQNLLSNAVKYTQQGKILLAVRRRGEHALIQVWDTGIGISAASQAHIFEDFYRVDNTLQTGHGLGLGVVARMSERLGIHMQVNSVPEKGSCFAFLLPLTEPIETEQVMTTAIKAGLQGLRCLVVDDKQQNLDAMQALLSKWQAQVQIAVSVHAAQTRSEQFAPQVLLVDFDLAENINGIELIKQLRRTIGRQIPAALVTASREPQVLAQCEEQHISYISKPVRPAKLRAWLNAQMNSLNQQVE